MQGLLVAIPTDVLLGRGLSRQLSQKQVCVAFYSLLQKSDCRWKPGL
jgi:hypothetical protein